jgi:hypothetical protein
MRNFRQRTANEAIRRVARRRSYSSHVVWMMESDRGEAQARLLETKGKRCKASARCGRATTCDARNPRPHQGSSTNQRHRSPLPPIAAPMLRSLRADQFVLGSNRCRFPVTLVVLFHFTFFDSLSIGSWN